jgi:hypothetical protein
VNQSHHFLNWQLCQTFGLSWYQSVFLIQWPLACPWSVIFNCWLITNRVWFSFTAVGVTLVCRWSVSTLLVPMLVRFLVVQWGILAVVGGFGWHPGLSYIYEPQSDNCLSPSHFNLSCSLSCPLILKTVFTRFNILFYMYVFLFAQLSLFDEQTQIFITVWIQIN